MFKVEDAERLQRLRISPMEVVEENRTIHVIHYLTFEGPWSGAAGEPKRSVNVNTDWEQVPGCEMGGELDASLERTLGLRAKHGVGARIL